MMKFIWQSFLTVPISLGAVLFLSGIAVSAESDPLDTTSFEPAGVESVTPLGSLAQPPIQLAQVTSVAELSDVQPTDWAYQALQSLVEQYGCIQGYPDRTFRGSAALTRYEFAAGLNACLDVISQLVATGINPEDLATIRRLQEEFQAELNTLADRVNALEADVAELEANQFSTTTQLRGQVDFFLATPFDPYISSVGPETSTTFNSRAFLDFDTSFTGEDRLRVRIQAGSGNLPLTDFRAFRNTAGVPVGTAPFNVYVDNLIYQFPIGDRLEVRLAAIGLGSDAIVRDILPFGSAIADISSPAYLDVGFGGGAGIGISYALTDNLILDAGYAVNPTGAADPAVGIFQGSAIGNGQSYGASLSYIPEGFLNLSVTYLHGDAASAFAGGPAFGGAVDTYGGQATLNFGSVIIGGYGAYTTFTGGEDFSWLAGIAFNDLFMEGAQLGIYGGQLPQTRTSPVDNPFLVEGYYNIPLNEFLTITPAVIYGNANNGTTDQTTIYGAIRTTFRF
jgi:hypothetical protein